MLLLFLLLAQVRLQDERLIARVTDMSGDVQASSCQGHLLLAWKDGSGVSAAVDGHRITINSATRGTPAVACGRGSWLVVWPSEGFGVDGRRVAFDGTLLEPISIFRGPFGASEVAAAYGSEAFLVAWADGVTIRAVRVNDAGAVVDAAPIGVAPSGFFVSPRVVWTGTTFFLGWAERGSNPISPAPTRIWGTRVSPQGKADPVALPMTGAGLLGQQPSLTAGGDRITVAWVAEHGAQTCVDVAQVNDSRVLLVPPKQIRCSGDASGDGVPVIDEAEILWSRGEHVLVWRELLPDFSSVLRAARLDGFAVAKDVPPYELLSRRGSAAWGPGLARNSDGVVAAYFEALAPPEEATAGVFVRVIEQEKPPARRRAVAR